MASVTILPKKSPTRSPQARPGFHLTRVKRQVLSLLAEYFCLRTNDLVQLVYAKQTEPNQASMRRTLGLLRKEGLLNRLPYLEPDLDRGGITFVYGLSDKGAAWEFPDKPKTFDEHSQRTLDHELEISFFHIALNRLCAQRNVKLYWQQRDLKCTINPDAYFAITDPAKPDGKNTFHYFLEIERAKLGHFNNGEPQIMTKLGKYYDYYNSPKCEKEWTHFRQFRVIVVQRTEAKRDFLLAKLAEKYKHRMFWLTTEELYKQEIGAEIFKTPRDFISVLYSLH
jgi:hypothetical protein